MFSVRVFSAQLAVLCLALGTGAAQKAAISSSSNSNDQWPTYGGDAGGMRYSASTQITKANVTQLKIAWTFHTAAPLEGAFESTPILFKGLLYLTSPLDEVFAIDPSTGQSRWAYRTTLATGRAIDIATSRGVASWSSSATAKATTPSLTTCEDRLFLGTLDARLLALDAATGQPCADFGNGGSVSLDPGIDYREGESYGVTSPPAVVGDVVVVGSGIPDNNRVNIERGDVRGYDVRTGKLLWTWEPLPWANGQKLRTGAGNTWGAIAADVEHGLLYLPTSSPSPDYYGGMRVGNNQDADSIVAIDARTGRKVWSFQVVHHDLWDYDIASEPLLFNFRGVIPAVAVATKMGFVFVFNRLTGEPLYRITERPVPQTDVPGEVTSPTQPFPALPALSPISLDMSQQLAASPADDAACRKVIANVRYDGIYTPPSFKGSLMFPSNVGGVNWGSIALDPATGILYANTNRAPYVVRLLKRPFFDTDMPILATTHAEKVLVLRLVVVGTVLLLLLIVRYRRRAAGWCLLGFALLAFVACLTSQGIYARFQNNPWLGGSVVVAKHFGREYGRNIGAPYVVFREPLVSSTLPCGPTPWGALSALNLNTGKSAWQTPLGTEMPGRQTGTLSVGGPIVTASGLVFTAGSHEPLLRAFDAATGKELWDGTMPVPAQATPMTYTVNGKQYIVVSAGGHSTFGTKMSDSVVAFALP